MNIRARIWEHSIEIENGNNLEDHERLSCQRIGLETFRGIPGGLAQLLDTVTSSSYS